MTVNEVKDMFCPKCNNPCGDSDRFCFRCGAALTEEFPVIPPKPKKGSHWVPALIMLVMSVVGLILYFATTADPKSPAVSVPDTPWFTIQEGYVFFDETKYTGSAELTIPEQINGQTVYGLGQGCFENCTKLTTVILPDTIKSIENNAFAGCTSLRGIYLPNSVTVLGKNAFSGCSNLEAICIPASVRWIGADAFDDCDNLFYIIYSGTSTQWAQLYNEFINIYTGVYCQDGSFYHGRNP